MNTHPDRRANAVAILSSDPLLAALLGAAVELVGYRAAFARAGESASDALRRARAGFVLLDTADALSTDEAFLGRALMTGARLFLFGSAAAVEGHAELAARYGMGVIALPRDLDSLHAILSRRVSPRGRHASSLEQ